MEHDIKIHISGQCINYLILREGLLLTMNTFYFNGYSYILLL